MRKSLLLLAAFMVAVSLFGQHDHFTRQDTLRGSITPEREWWDLLHYHLDISVHPSDSTLAGKNTVRYRVLDEAKRMQIDLQRPLKIDSVLQNGQLQLFEKEGNAYFISLSQEQQKGSENEVEIWYSGKPRIAIRPPWDGGITWRVDDYGNPFVASSCQGIGASVWWPCKDHMYDEPDSMRISVRVPPGLMDVSNGRLISVENHPDSSTTFHWEVRNPINNYGVNINVGDYVHFADTFPGEHGPLSCDFYVLRDNLQKAKKHFKEAHRTLAALEHWYGPYPFYEDGYKLVEAPYLGMEHQSSVTYGNGFDYGYLGMDLSRSGWGMKFDFIIVHETAHEWFANNITYKDIADMWVHEAFAAYAEALFVEFHYGKDAGGEYVTGTRANVVNNAPIIGPYGVNKEGSNDMYYKGANMLHTLRQVLDNDDKWREILRGLNEEFRHQTVTTKQVEDYISEHFGRDLTPIFNQYLRDVRIPVLQYYWRGNNLHYQWVNVVEGFDMPLKLKVGKTFVVLHPTTQPATKSFDKGVKKLDPNPDYYVSFRKINPDE